MVKRQDVNGQQLKSDHFLPFALPCCRWYSFYIDFPLQYKFFYEDSCESISININQLPLSVYTLIQTSYLSQISQIISVEKICLVEKFQISAKNNLLSFIKIYAVFVLNLCGEKSGWRKNDNKYEVCSSSFFTWDWMI